MVDLHLSAAAVKVKTIQIGVKRFNGRLFLQRSGTGFKHTGPG